MFAILNNIEFWPVTLKKKWQHCQRVFGIKL